MKRGSHHVHCLTPKKSHTLIFYWATLDLMMAHISSCNITTFPSRVRVIFLHDPVLMMGESAGLLQHIPKILNGIKVCTLWQPIQVWKPCLMLPEPLFHNLSQMNRGIVIFEYAHANREETKFTDGKTWLFFIHRYSTDLISLDALNYWTETRPSEETPDHKSAKGLYSRH